MKTNIPQGYKQTELGIIPEDWEVKQISDFTAIVTGGTPSTQHPEFWGGDIRWMNSGELNLRFIYDVEGRITEVGLNNSSTHIIPAKCVLVGLAGQGKTRGTAAYNLVSLCTNQSIAAFLPTDKHSSLYLYYVIDSMYDYLRLLSSGDGGRGGLNKQILSTLNIVLPPLAEQRAIAEALSDVDGLIAALDKKIAKKRLIKQGAMQQLLTGKTRLPGFTDEWVEKKLGDVGVLLNGYAFKSETYNKAGTYNIITIANVQNGKLTINDCNRLISVPSDIQEHQKLKKNDILISMTGNVGRACLVNANDCLLNQRVGLFVVRDIQNCDKHFIFTIMNDGKFENTMIESGQGAAQANIGKKDIEGFTFLLPTNIEEQQAIATILSDMDKEIADLEAQRNKYRLLKSGMMQKLLTGQIRLQNE